MPDLESSNRLDEKLVQMIQHRIHLNTWGRIHELQVEAHGNRVIIHGSSPSYYLVQLAVSAVREVLPSRPMELHIRVIPTQPRAPVGYNGSKTAKLPQDLGSRQTRQTMDLGAKRRLTTST
jgi:hypothetical protein